MKRIGILSLFYNSLNFGGTLQAYALCRYCNTHGYDARQITFDVTRNEAGFAKNMHRVISRVTDPDTPFFPQCKKYLHIISCSVMGRLFNKHGFDGRRAAFEAFRRTSIPATGYAYTDQTVFACRDQFDAFIAGSDIIWNPFLTDSDAFFLSFAPKDKPKIAYAASLGTKTLGRSQDNTYIRRLKIPDAISTREKSAQTALSRLTDKPIETVLDPTLLLTADDYAEVMSPELIGKPYIFCYLLGGGKSEKKAAKRIAAAYQLPLVTVPSPGGEFHIGDRQFGDIRMNGAGPDTFLSLVGNAALVVTDSFHAIAFSVIYHKNFLALKRHSDKNPMSLNARLVDFTEMLGLSDRLVMPDAAQPELLQTEIDYEAVDARLQEQRAASVKFLTEALETGVPIEA